MQGKYSSWVRLAAAWGARFRVVHRLRGVVDWEPLSHPKPGCTALIGMCHRLPDVLLANLRCLAAARWPALTKAIVVVDSTRGSLPDDLVTKAGQVSEGFEVSFSYYSEAQARLAEELKLPYVFSWLSWCIAIAQCETTHALIHDYDALVFRDSLKRRYQTFVQSGADVQGIRWYSGNGIVPEDRLATTFEAFASVPWMRARPPLALFNRIGYRRGRSVDYDTLLWLQDVRTPLSRRTISEMREDELVHPSQMIHQYTMFRRSPGKALPCFSMPMIPFFDFLSGKQAALRNATRRLRLAKGRVVDLFGDGTLVNLSMLTRPEVDWALKQMVAAALLLDISPFRDLHDYGRSLYETIEAQTREVWEGDFTPPQRDWIQHSEQTPLAEEA